MIDCCPLRDFSLGKNATGCCAMPSMSSHRQIVRGSRIVLPSGTSATDVLLEDERILAIAPYGTLSAPQVVDAAERLVIPGIVNSHVHTRDPGQNL